MAIKNNLTYSWEWIQVSSGGLKALLKGRWISWNSNQLVRSPIALTTEVELPSMEEMNTILLKDISSLLAFWIAVQLCWEWWLWWLNFHYFFITTEWIIVLCVFSSVILEESTRIRIKMFHHRIKIVIQKNFISAVSLSLHETSGP